MSQVCVHTSDKQYSLKPSEQVNPSSIDFNSMVQHSTIYNEHSLTKKVWSGDEIVYWKMDTDYPYIDGVKLEEKVVKLALLESSMKTNLIIRQRKRGTADAQLLINWFGKKDESFFTSESILAFAYGPEKGIGGNVTMNADVPWGLQDEIINGRDFEDRFNRTVQNENNLFKVYDSLHTMKHEAGGHAMGMPHIQDINYKFTDIMYPYYNGVRNFGEKDIQLLYLLYKKASINHKIREMLLSRIGKGVMA